MTSCDVLSGSPQSVLNLGALPEEGGLPGGRDLGVKTYTFIFTSF